MNEEVKDLFENLIEVGYEIRISKGKDVSLFPNYNYGFLVKEIYESIIEPTDAPSRLLYQAMISLVNSESLKESTGAILDNKLIFCYNYKLCKVGWITYKDMKVNLKISDGIKELTIGLLLKIYELNNNGDDSYYYMNEFKHGL